MTGGEDSTGPDSLVPPRLVMGLEAAKEYEYAARLRDEIDEVKGELGESAWCGR